MSDLMTPTHPTAAARATRSVRAGLIVLTVCLSPLALLAAAELLAGAPAVTPSGGAGLAGPVMAGVMVLAVLYAIARLRALHRVIDADDPAVSDTPAAS